MPRQQAELRPPAVAMPVRPSGSEAAASYSLMTNEADRKITASLDREMPTGTSLAVALQASAGAVAHAATLSAAAATDVVTAIPSTNEQTLPARYVIRASSGARVMAHGEARMVIYTIIAGP